MKIVIDLLGADAPILDLLQGVKIALQERNDWTAVLVGPEEILSKELTAEEKKRVEILPCNEYIKNTEDPVMSLRRKKDSSTVLGMNYLVDQDLDGFISAGSTGALLAGGLFIVRRIKGINRACLAAILPNPYGGVVLVDTGANMDTTPEILVQFARMGSIYAEAFLHRKQPKVALLNVGTEEGKGDKRAKETFQLLKEDSLNFVGNMEARDILKGDCDVLVADGFAGNVLLKSLEGTAKMLMDELKKGIYSSVKTKMAGAMLKPVFKTLAENYNYKEHGGAPLLGVKKPVYKAHGNSDAKTFALGILELLDYIPCRIEDQIAAGVEKEDL